MKRLSSLSAIVVIFCSVFLLYSCHSPELKKTTITGKALGTFYTIHFYHTENKTFSENIKGEIDSLLSHFSDIASIYVQNSVISRINNNEPYEINEMFNDIFNKAQEISEITDGAFDITVAPLVNAWGFGSTPPADITQNFIDSLLQFVGYEKLKLTDKKVQKQDNRIMLDMNGIAKGYAVDMVSSYLEDNGIDRYLVEIGGEIRAGNCKPDGSLWSIGIEKPAETAYAPQSVEKLIFLKNKAVATSGSYRRYYEKNGKKYSHTIDPKTGYPVMHSMLSATIIANDCVTADALATACMVMGAQKALSLCESLPNIEAFFIIADTIKEFLYFNTTGFEIFFTDPSKNK